MNHFTMKSSIIPAPRYGVANVRRRIATPIRGFCCIQRMYCSSITAKLSPTSSSITSNYRDFITNSTVVNMKPDVMQFCDNVVRRSYSVTPIVSLSLRRRRGRSSGGLGSGIDDETTAIELASEPSTVTEQERKLIDPTVFLLQAKSFFDKIQKAMEPLVKINDGMVLSRGDSSQIMFEEQDRKETSEKKDDEADGSVAIPTNGKIIDGPYLLLELGPIHGQYTFVADMESNTIFFQSPISGQLIYYYNTKTNDWSNIHDEHNLEGIFVRDIIRQIQGVPKL